MAIDFAAYLASIKGKKPPYRCPVEKCAKTYKMFKRLESHCEKHRQEMPQERQQLHEENSRSSGSTSSQQRAFAAMGKKIRDIFSKSQEACNLNICVELLSRFPFLGDSEKSVAACKSLQQCINFALCGDDRSPYTLNTLVFISKFCVKQTTAPVEDKENVTSKSADDSGSEPDDDLAQLMDDDDDESAVPQNQYQIVDIILKDFVKPNLLNEMIAVRINSCLLIRLITNEVSDLSSDVCEEIRDALIQRMADRSSSVRANAARGLHRFQGQTTTTPILVSALRHHLTSDSDADVRQAVLCSIYVNKDTLPDIIKRTRDIKDQIRKLAYKKIYEQVKMKQLSMEQRMQLLQQGLADRNSAVERVVRNDLVAKWMKESNNVPETLLENLDIENYEDTCEKLLRTLFDNLAKQSVDDRRTKFHLYVDQFTSKFLDSRRLLLKEHQTIEICFLWYSIAKYSKDNSNRLSMVRIDDDEEANTEFQEIDRILENVNLSTVQEEEEEAKNRGDVDSSQNTSIIDMEALEEPDKAAVRELSKKPSSVSGKDPLSMLLPEIPHFCTFLRKFVEEAIEARGDYDKERRKEINYVFTMMTKLMLLMNITEEARRKIVQTTFTDILFMKHSEKVFDNLSRPLMKILYKKIFRSTPQLYDFARDLTTVLYNEAYHDEGDLHLTEEEEQADPSRMEIEFGTVEPAMAELESARLGLEIEELRDELDRAIDERRFADAEKLNMRMDELKKKRLQLNAPQNPTETVAPPVVSQAKKAEPSEDDLQVLYLKGCQIFTSAIELGKATKMNDFIHTHLDRIVFPSMISMDTEVRQLAATALGIVALFDANFAKQRMKLFINMIWYDQPSVAAIGLQGLMDLFIHHGLDRFTAEHPSNQKPSSQQTSEGGSDEETADSDRPAKKQKTTESVEEMTLEELIDIIINLFDRTLNHESDEIRHVAVEGVAKLLQHGRILSPRLFQSLLMIWYCDATEQRTKNFIGEFMPTFAYADNKRALAADELSTVQQSFIPSIRAAFDNMDNEERFTSPSLEQCAIENMISYLVALLNFEDMHVQMFFELLDEIMSVFRRSMANKERLLLFYFKALTVLSLNSVSEEELPLLKSKLATVEAEVKKRVTNDIQLFKGKLRTIAKKVEAAEQKFEQLREDQENEEPPYEQNAEDSE